MKYFYLLILFVFMACQSKINKSSSADITNIDTISNLTEVNLELMWESDTLLSTAESVIFDEQRKQLYVACINGVSPWVHDGDGFIAKMDLEGNILERKWIEGMSAPKGMGIYGDTLYVTDIDQVIRIDISKGQILDKIKIEGAENLNDLTVAHDGDVFVSDSKASSIHIIKGKEVLPLFSDPAMEGINGLYMKDDTLFMAGRKSGSVYRIQHGNLNPRKLVDLPAGGDGVEKYRDAFIISSWHGQVFFVDNQWNYTELINSVEEKVNTADIEVIEDQNLLLVPTFFDNRVVAYKIKSS